MVPLYLSWFFDWYACLGWLMLVGVCCIGGAPSSTSSPKKHRPLVSSSPFWTCTGSHVQSQRSMQQQRKWKLQSYHAKKGTLNLETVAATSTATHSCWTCQNGCEHGYARGYVGSTPFDSGCSLCELCSGICSNTSWTHGHWSLRCKAPTYTAMSRLGNLMNSNWLIDLPTSIADCQL